jgi:hypothetical protein
MAMFAEVDIGVGKVERLLANIVHYPALPPLEWIYPKLSTLVRKFDDVF